MTALGRVGGPTERSGSARAELGQRWGSAQTTRFTVFSMPAMTAE